METTVKKREWVKDAAIIFLAVLLVLTFFSNTIMNRSLPEVATAPVTNGNIVAKVRGSGTVAANGKHQVKAKETRTIRSVMVKAGQEVNAGDVLFVLGEGDETELERAKETLRELQYAYQKAAVSIPSFDYSSYQRAINNAEKAVERRESEYREAKKACEDALKQYNMSGHSIEQVKAEAKKVESLKTALDAAADELAIAKANLDSLNSRLAAAEAEVEELERQKAALEAEIAALEAAGSSQNPDSNAGAPDPADIAQGENGNSSQNQSGFNTQQHEQNNSEIPAEEIQLPEESEPEPEALSTREAKGKIVFLTATTFYNEEKTGGIVKLSNGSVLDELRMELAAVEARLQAAKANRDSIRAEMSSIEGYDEALRAARERYDYCQMEYYTAIERYKGMVPASLIPIIENYEYAAEVYEDAEDELYFAYLSLENAVASNQKTTAVAGIDLQLQAEKIKAQQEKIKSLAGEESNVVTANVSGTVDTVDCTAGDTVLKDALMCTIEVPDMGHTLSFSVTNEQAQRLRIGDSATVSNYYWGNSVTATLTSIRTDPKNPQGGKVLTFDLTGDVSTGAEMTIAVGQKSANYDLIVPNSAIKSDTNGSYVLAVTAKSSPLGNRYAARRVSVEVLASDDNNSAVLADLTNGDYVITTSSAPLKSGDLVRMADS